ncbi:MAG: hypothetical protein HZA17_01630 [Nitrospirae bacterium]|nr:hypothetical protein [Nitrospirota bacterium]
MIRLASALWDNAGNAQQAEKLAIKHEQDIREGGNGHAGHSRDESKKY